MDSLRSSCSRMALAAASKSLKVLGLTAAICEITALFSGSTFSTALQHGQPTSKGSDDDFAFAIRRLYAYKHAGTRAGRCKIQIHRYHRAKRHVSRIRIH